MSLANEVISQIRHSAELPDLVKVTLESNVRTMASSPSQNGMTTAAVSAIDQIRFSAQISEVVKTNLLGKLVRTDPFLHHAISPHEVSNLVLSLVDTGVKTESLIASVVGANQMLQR
jgi:enoyl-[acyl-carrier-protein] reductase (NADH)